MTKRDVLYVDDESENLIVFQATFEDRFNVVTATSGQEALELMAQRTFPVVVADQRMPRMSGAQLFEAMRDKFPHTKRVMLTGYADSKAMLDAINKGQVYYFIKKPWEEDFVFSILVRAIEAYDMAVSNMVLQERLVAMDRAATLGRSAAQLAHEMGNQLCMLPLLELIEERYSDQEELVQMAGFARTTHERLLQIINEVKAFVRFEREQVVMQPISLAGVLHELLEFVRHERSLPLERLIVEMEADPLVNGNRIKLQQVVLNLLKNAAYAIRGREGGQIKLRLSVADSQAAITVSDNGCGMSQEIAARIWEPFFTTKGDEGTGVGLDLSKSIVEAHGGTIDCLTAPDQGATFTIRLPVWNDTQVLQGTMLSTGGFAPLLATPQTA
jgi:two-component system sensor histidine kinase/response regulator